MAYIVAGKGRGLGLVNLGGGIYVCVDTLRMNGYCDCGGTGAAKKNVVDCQDRDIYRKCPAGLADLGNDNCGSQCAAGLADVNFPGAVNGLPKITCAVPTTQGDCVNALMNQFGVITNAYYGTDGKPCTADDTGGADTPTTVVLTTGQAAAQIWNPVMSGGYGTCAADPSVDCVSNCQNRCLGGWCEVSTAPTACSSKLPCSTVCSAATYDPIEPQVSPVQTGAKPVAGTSFPYNVSNVCDLYRQNRLVGMSLVGAFPGSSGTAGGGLGDNLSWFNLDCK
jgi:hypothetical protein